MLDKSVLRDHFLEFGALDEVIVFAVDLMRTRFTGSVYGIEQSVWLAR